MNAILSAGGLKRGAVTASEIASIEPALNGTFYGGYYTPSDATGDIHKFTRGLADSCLDLGVDFIFDADTKISHQRDRIEVTWASTASRSTVFSDDNVHTKDFDAIVICAGVGSRAMAKVLGDRVNIYPVKGYSITVSLDQAASQAAAPWISILDDKAKIVTSRLGKDRFRVAGTAEFNGQNRDIRMDRVKPLVDWTRGLFPGIDTSKVVPWAGLRPMTPSMLPRVGRGRRVGVLYNTGHGHLGWTLSAATAEIVAEEVALTCRA